MAVDSNAFQKILKLNTLCVGGTFGRLQEMRRRASDFPFNVLQQTADFDFCLSSGFEEALDVAASNQDIDLIFLDADFNSLPAMSTFITQLQEIRPRLPVVVFSNRVDETMRKLMRAGAAWHFTKYADAILNLADHIHRQVFSPVDWEEIFAYYARDEVKPRIEPGINSADLEAICGEAEEQYIIKRLFANSDIVQIFRMDEGFSGSRIYTVKPRHQLKRILKIGPAEDLEAVQDKQERLIQPRLYRQVGQIRGKVVSAQHLGGACYSLAGSNQEAITLTQFLQDQNRVRKELLDKILRQLQDSLGELYSGNSEMELRYWAPLYSQVLPPFFTLEEAMLVGEDELQTEFVLQAGELSSVSAVPGNETLEQIKQAVRHGEKPRLTLHGFEVAELDSKKGVLYLHDRLAEKHAADPLLAGKEHPLLRFKIHLRPSEHGLLTHPVFRRGKQISISGLVCETQETILADNIGRVTGQPYDYDEKTFDLASGRFIPLLENIRYLLWDVGREDMITPMPIVAPVVHGDLNGGNILVEASQDVPLWLIDFSDARPGHIYFDLAKLEVEVRTHVFYRLLEEMVSEGIWDETTAQQFALLIENHLLQQGTETFEEFCAGLRDHQADWFDQVYTQFPLYFENLLYFIFSLRRIARAISPERFDSHYGVAVFFQSVAAIKYESLNQRIWAKRAALCCALVHGKEAVARVKRSQDTASLLGRLRQRSALALVTVGEGDKRKYLMQWNENWESFNLVGGRVNNAKGDRDSFARALQRKLVEELGLRSPKDYRIVREMKPVVRKQFSRRDHVFKDYEFRLFEIELLARHPRDSEEFARYVQRFSSEHENVLLSGAEIQHLRTVAGRPISLTTRMILQAIGEIESVKRRDLSTMLDLDLEDERPLVNRGRVQVRGSLVNARFGNLIENITMEVLPRPAYTAEPQSAFIRISELDAGQEHPFELWLQAREEGGKLTMRVTYYDTRGNEYRQILETPILFRSPVFSLFHLDNPYVVGQPLKAGDESLFFGREEVFAWMGGNLLAQERPRSMILSGAKKSGKTSTLLQLVNGALSRALREFPENKLIPIYISIEELDIANSGAFFANLSHLMARTLRHWGISVPAPDSWPVNEGIYKLFDSYLDEVELALPEDALLVLIIDDVQHLQRTVEEGLLDSDLVPYLHSLMQLRARLAFVFGASWGMQDPFWQLIYQVADKMELAPLSRRETERLIREPVQPLVRYDELAVEHIWRTTMGHPYLTQLICQRLIENIDPEGGRQKMVTVDQVHQVLVRILEEDDGFIIGQWEDLSARQQQLLYSIGELQGPGDDAVPFSALIPIEGDEGLEADLEQLLQRGLVVKQRMSISNGQMGLDGEDYYLLATGLLRRWVINKERFSSKAVLMT